MIRFFYNLSPNPMKVALLLEEFGLDYQPVPIDVQLGEQFSPDFTALNPNGKVPCVVDGSTTIFDSTAILLHYAEAAGRFLPASRPELLSWLMFTATGVGPYSGQAVHFNHRAGPGHDYSRTRYGFEAERHYAILDRRLADTPFVCGGEYSIVDMAVWAWARMVPHVLDDAGAWTRLPHLKRLVDDVAARPAAGRALALKDRHTFATAMDDKARRIMFRHLGPA